MSEMKLTADAGGGTVALKAPSSTTGNNPVLFKLPVADGSAGQVLKTDGSGNISFIYPCGYGHFKAYMSGNQTVTYNAEEILELDTVQGSSDQNGNANSWFNTTTHKFTPTVAGWYHLYLHLFWDATADNKDIKLRARMKKNDSTYIADNYAGIDDQYGAFAHDVSTIIYLNGSSDYVEFKVKSDHVEDNTNPVLQGGGASYTQAWGYLLEAA